MGNSSKKRAKSRRNTVVAEFVDASQTNSTQHRQIRSYSDAPLPGNDIQSESVAPNRPLPPVPQNRPSSLSLYLQANDSPSPPPPPSPLPSTAAAPSEASRAPHRRRYTLDSILPLTTEAMPPPPPPAQLLSPEYVAPHVPRPPSPYPPSGPGSGLSQLYRRSLAPPPPPRLVSPPPRAENAPPRAPVPTPPPLPTAGRGRRPQLHSMPRSSERNTREDGHFPPGSAQIIRQLEEMGFRRGDIVRTMEQLRQHNRSTMDLSVVLEALVSESSHDPVAPQPPSGIPPHPPAAPQPNDEERPLPPLPLPLNETPTEVPMTDRPVREKEKPSEEGDEEELCKICYENEIDVVILRCGHLCICQHCSAGLRQCPICRKQIVEIVKVYRA